MMRLDHIAIIASDCTLLRSFFVDIVGMQEGARPAFGVPGHWLYLDQLPVVHLIQRPRRPANTDPDPGPGRPPASIDHVALRIDNALQWHQLLLRLRDHQVPYQLSTLHALHEQQLFATPVPQVTVEFVIAARHLTQEKQSSI